MKGREINLCLICHHANETGWWGQEGTHCRDCHRSWRGHTQAHCVRCCLHFGSNAAADLHLLPGGECGDPAVLFTKDGKPRLKQVNFKDGPVWVSYRDRDPAWVQKWYESRVETESSPA